MDKIILEELEKMIQLAIAKGLIPSKDFKEIEFNILECGQAVSIEYWSCSKRCDSDRTIIDIPDDLQSRFIFKNTVKPFK